MIESTCCREVVIVSEGVIYIFSPPEIPNSLNKLTISCVFKRFDLRLLSYTRRDIGPKTAKIRWYI